MTTHRVWVALFVIAVAAAVAYAGVFGLGLVYDDHRLVTTNPSLDGPWASLFGQDLSGGGNWGIYRPLVAVSWKLERLLPDPVVAHHVGNLAWHVVAAWCVFGLACTFARGRAGSPAAPAAVATLFAVHPLTSEAVCWVSRRGDVMAAALGLASLLVCVNSNGARRGPVLAVAAVALAAASMLSKEIGVIVPALWVVGLALRQAPRRQLVFWAVGAIGLIGGYAALRMLLIGSVTGQPVAFVQNWVNGVPDTSRAVIVVKLALHAVTQTLIPTGLSADYSWRSIEPGFTASDLFPILALVVAGVGLVRSRRHPGVWMGLAIIVAAYVPVSNAFVLVGAAFADRFLYLPLAGVAIALGSIAASNSDRRVPASVAVVALVAVLLTRHHVPVWANDESLFRAVLHAYPENVVAHTYRGIASREAGDRAGALQHYTDALDVYPEYHLARVNRAFLMLEAGETEAALAEAEWIIANEPEPGAPHLIAGIAHAELAARPGPESGSHAEKADTELWRAAADPAIRRDALTELAAIYSRRGDQDGMARVRRAATAR